MLGARNLSGDSGGLLVWRRGWVPLARYQAIYLSDTREWATLE